MKITKENIRRFTDEALERYQDELQEGTELFIAIEKEFDRRAERINRVEKTKLREKVRLQQEMEARQKELESLKEAYSDRVVMKAQVDEFGDQFYDDYVITCDFRVISYAGKEIHARLRDKIGGYWQCDNYEKAKKKVWQLVQYRVFNHYFREPDQDSLDRLNNRIIEIINRGTKS